MVDSNNYVAALTAYSNTYASLPFGDTATVTAALLGSNDHKYAFLHTPPQTLNARGEFLDPWHRPYEIEVSSNSFRFKSLSK